jgi:oligopeptidase A
MNAADNINPLLDFSGPTRFDAIRVEHVTPAVDRLIGDARAAVDAIALDAGPATWDSVAEPLAEPLDRLDRAWGVVAHLHAVASTPEWRATYHANLPRISAFHTDLAQDLRLFHRYRDLVASPSFTRLDAARQRAVANECATSGWRRWSYLRAKRRASRLSMKNC